jgi:hypothetical protein
MEEHSSGTLKIKLFENQKIIKSLGARKPKGLNRIAQETIKLHDQ